MSLAFENFLKSNFFGNPFNAWHDGLDVHMLVALQGDELAQAEAILLKALPDHRAVVGLGEIRSQKAIEPIRKLINSNVSTEAAVALVKITGETGGQDSVIKSLKRQNDSWGSRMDAAIALRNFRTKAAVVALLDALDDPEMLVRHHASLSLLYLYKQINTNDPARLSFSSTGVKGEQERAAVLDALRQMVKDGKLDGI